MPASTAPARLDATRPMWKAVVAMYLAGGATLFAVLPAPEPDPSDHTALAIIGAVLLVAGVALWRLGPRRRLLQATAVGGTLVVSLIVLVSKPVGASPFFYLWPILIAGYYLPKRQLAIALGLFYAGFAAGLAFGNEEHTRMVLFIGGASSFTLAAIVVHRLRGQLDRLIAELERTASHDPLTGVLNRRGFEQAFARDLEQRRRTGRPLSVVVFDLDHFKQVNDRFGHAVGDQTLKTFAAVLADQGRAGDLVARTGGEEFAVVLVDTDLDGALAYARRVAAAPQLASAPGGPVGVSAGVVEAGGTLHTGDELLLAADRLLYAAKDAGRGRAAVHGDPPQMHPLPPAAPVAA